MTRTRWLALRCDASMQSPSTYGSDKYGTRPPPAPDGKMRCPVCWKAVKMVVRAGFGGSRIPAHNVDQEMLRAKDEAFETARLAATK